MSERRLEWKVGLFVLISVLLGVALIVSLSKGTFWWARTYDVLLQTKDLGGLIRNSPVLLSGARIGTVESTILSPTGDSVTVRLRISTRYRIRRDARFSIEQSGLLGDRYVAITPTADALPELQDGDQVDASQAFDFQEVARAAAGFLQRTDEAVGKVKELVERLDRVLFTETTLTNLASTVANLQLASERGVAILTGLDQFVKTNTQPVSTSLSNLVAFTEQLNQTASDFRLLVSTNRSEVAAAIQHIGAASTAVESLATDLQKGQGVIGALLKDPSLQQQFASMVSNVSVASSNLARFGLLYRPPAVTPPTTSGSSRGPFLNR